MKLFEYIEYLKSEIDKLKKEILSIEIKKAKLEMNLKKKNNQITFEDLTNLNGVQDLQRLDMSLDIKKRYLAYYKELFKDYSSKILCRSSFNVDEIGLVLEELLNEVTNKKYKYNKIINRTTTYSTNRYGENNSYNDNVVAYIGLDDRNYDINLLYNDPDAIILSDNCLNNSICFYDDKCDKTINVKKNDVIYDFIDYLIAYRIENDVIYISKEKLQDLLSKYDPNCNKNKENIFIKKYNTCYNQ